MHEMINSNRPTIGYLSRNNSEAYELECQSGVIAAARDCDINLLCFIGGALDDRQGHLHQRNKIYEWVCEKNIDGLLVSTATIGHIVDKERLREFLLAYAPLPVISLGIPFEGIPYLTVDNRQGIHELMIHLIQVHHLKRIAFIKGPKDNYEAINRFKGYQDALKLCNLAPDKNLVLEGDYLRDSGRKAVIRLLDGLKIDFDAIVAANDNMALYAMKELQNRGIRVPEDIIVAGFDDLDEASSATPGLTTIKQPVFDMGYQAVMSMFKILNGDQIPLEIALPTNLKIRDSCGCQVACDFTLNEEIKTQSQENFKNGKSKIDPDELLQELKGSLSRKTRITFQDSWFKNLIKLMKDEIEQQANCHSLSQLKSQIFKSLEKGVDITVWQKAVTSIVKILYVNCLKNTDREAADSYLKKALVYIGKTGEQYHKNVRIRDREIFYALSRINEGLTESIRKDDLKKLFSKELWIMAVKSCYLALYVDGSDYRFSRLYLAFDDEGHLVPSNKKYPSEELIPGSFNTKTGRYQYIVVPLVFKEEQLGFIILDVGDTGGNQYESLADQLAKSFKREEMDHQIREQSAQLEKKVEDRTIDLNNTINQLKKATHKSRQLAKEANSANEAKSNFLANMSHEIRTPMNGILGMLDLLTETNLDKEQIEYAKIIQGSAETLLVIINDILDFSKIEAGKMEINSIDFDLRSAVETVSELLAAKAVAKDLEFISLVNSNVPSYLKGDPGRLKQILLNLSGNAIKFTEKGEVVINVKLESETETHVTIRFEVIDTGIGIAEKEKQHLFKSFSQVDVSVTRKYGGTGLGLAISQQLVAKMGGEIGFNSTPEKGSTFWFTARFERQVQESRNKLIPPAELIGKRIIVVDDNKTNRQVFQEYLKSCQCQIEMAANGREALNKMDAAAANNLPFEIALIDMNMPIMDGESLGKQIKASPTLRNTSLIILTSLGARGDAERVEEIGFSAYLPKPIKKNQLLDCLAMISNNEKYKDNNLSEAPLITQHTLKESQKNTCILLVEDNKVNQKLAVKVLEKMNYRVDVAENGVEAITALTQRNYDLVLMDLQMPEMGGLEATKIIRTPSSPVMDHDIPIIAMTAHVKDANKTSCIEIGMNGFISKPFKRDRLFEEINRFVN